MSSVSPFTPSRLHVFTGKLFTLFNIILINNSSVWIVVILYIAFDLKRNQIVHFDRIFKRELF